MGDKKNKEENIGKIEVGSIGRKVRLSQIEEKVFNQENKSMTSIEIKDKDNSDKIQQDNS